MLKLEQPNFSLTLPGSFQTAETDGVLHCICREPPGVLHLTSQEVENKDELPNLSRMLAGFLTRSGHPVATDELLQITSVPEAHGFSWQYTREERYHRLWLFGNELSWLLLHFVCPQEVYGQFHELLSESIKTLRLRHDERHPSGD